MGCRITKGVTEQCTARLRLTVEHDKMLLHELLTHVFEVDLLLFVVIIFLVTEFSFLLFSLFAEFCHMVINGDVLVTF